MSLIVVPGLWDSSGSNHTFLSMQKAHLRSGTAKSCGSSPISVTFLAMDGANRGLNPLGSVIVFNGLSSKYFSFFKLSQKLVRIGATEKRNRGALDMI